MPTRRTPEVPPATGTSLVADDEALRAALLRDQANQVTTAQALPKLAMLPAGVALFEFSDTQDTVRTFEAVILNSHPRNVMWDRPYGVEAASEAEKLPACASHDGITGIPREGFAHASMPVRGTPAIGDEQFSCHACAYNQFNSKTLLGQSGKGKACTNQKSVYLMLDGREAPVELTLSPTSLSPFDAYLTQLIGQGIVMQQTLTKFSQVKIEKNGLTWCVIKLERLRSLEPVEFQNVMARRAQFMASITPRQIARITPAAGADGENGDDERVDF